MNRLVLRDHRSRYFMCTQCDFMSVSHYTQLGAVFSCDCLGCENDPFGHTFDDEEKTACENFMPKRNNGVYFDNKTGRWKNIINGERK